MKKELITVIIPIYNVEKYLNKCITSVIHQTYENLEIILVNDGSTDNCIEICNFYAKKDNRIKIINKENGGLSDARNVAIDVAHGEYITFVDSDDYIDLDMIELLYQEVNQYKADIAVCSYQSFLENVEIQKNNESISELVYNNQDALETMLYQKDCTTSAWGKLYKTKLFEDIRYPKGKICEDLDTTYLLFAKSSKIVINNQKKYFYLQRKNSIINSKFNVKRMDALSFSEKQTEFIEKNFPEIKKSAINREFMEAIFIYQQIPFQKEYKTYKKKLNNAIKKNRNIVLKDKKSKTGYRILAVFSYIGIFMIPFIFKVKKTVDEGKRK